MFIWSLDQNCLHAKGTCRKLNHSSIIEEYFYRDIILSWILLNLLLSRHHPPHTPFPLHYLFWSQYEHLSPFGFT